MLEGQYVLVLRHVCNSQPSKWVKRDEDREDLNSCIPVLSMSYCVDSQWLPECCEPHFHHLKSGDKTHKTFHLKRLISSQYL